MAAGLGNQLTGKREGKETNVRFEEITCPDSDGKNKIKTCAFHVEEDGKTMPYSGSTPAYTLHKCGIPEYSTQYKN